MTLLETLQASTKAEYNGFTNIEIITLHYLLDQKRHDLAAAYMFGLTGGSAARLADLRTASEDMIHDLDAYFATHEVND